MAKFEFEVVFPVEDYFEEEFDGDEEIAFESASEDYDRALESGKEEVKELLGVKKLPKGLRFGVDFLEFDSSNITHAGAYFKITVTGPNKIIKKLEEKYEEFY